MFSIPCPTPGGPSDKRNIADSYKNNLSLPPDPLFPDLTIHSHLLFVPKPEPTAWPLLCLQNMFTDFMATT